MIIMSYGGLRGAIAFALALILDETKIPRKKEFVTATIAVVFFTVFLQVQFDSQNDELSFITLFSLGNDDRTIGEVSQRAKETDGGTDHVSEVN